MFKINKDELMALYNDSLQSLDKLEPGTESYGKTLAHVETLGKLSNATFKMEKDILKSELNSEAERKIADEEFELKKEESVNKVKLMNDEFELKKKELELRERELEIRKISEEKNRKELELKHKELEHRIRHDDRMYRHEKRKHTTDICKMIIGGVGFVSYCGFVCYLEINKHEIRTTGLSKLMDKMLKVDIF